MRFKSALFIPLVCLALLSTGNTLAQPQKGTFIKVQAGYGLNARYDNVEVEGSGFYAQAEFVWAPTTWFGVRPYAGVLFVTSNSRDIPELYEITSNGVLLGVKARLLAPIPWVAPFFEVGGGLSLGTFKTRWPFTIVSNKGPVFHIPVSLGLAIGREHRFEVAFQYYYMDSVEQFAGAAAVGLTFPLD